MAATQFVLVSDWHFDAPLPRVWELIEQSQDWPSWWPAVERVELLREGEADGLGHTMRIHWKTALPYRIAFEVETVRVEKHREVEGRARGELDGTGIWSFSTEEQGGTHVRYLWRVEVTKRWMRLLAPLLRPVFTWNHNKVMAWGLAGARKRLVGTVEHLFPSLEGRG